MDASNLLFIISDQHQAAAMGCAGHPLVQTPNLDALAASGTRFSNAYTNCAICVPARASLATGRYVHEIGNWDNGLPYDGNAPSWMHRLREHGATIDTIGKLHFRGGDDYGFTREIEPLHVVDGIGDPASGIRDGSITRSWRAGIEEAGPRGSTYQDYDIRNRDNAIRWLNEHAEDEKPWALFLSFVTPHPPWFAPPEDYARYPHEDIELPPQWSRADWSHHPACAYMRRFFGVEEPFDEAVIRRLHATYYGICSFLDRQIGQVMAALDGLGLRERTRVIYTSDHGEHLGARGVYGKFTMYEEAAAVPMILAGAEAPAGKVVDTPVSLVDCHPSALQALGCPPHQDEDADLPGESLWELAAGDKPRAQRSSPSTTRLARKTPTTCCATGATSTSIMSMRRRSCSTLSADPDELDDLALRNDADTNAQLANYEMRLRDMIDPEAVDARAKADQQRRIEELGGREAVVARGSFINLACARRNAEVPRVPAGNPPSVLRRVGGMIRAEIPTRQTQPCNNADFKRRKRAFSIAARLPFFAMLGL